MSSFSFSHLPPIQRMLALLAIAVGSVPALWGGINGGDSVWYLDAGDALLRADWKSALTGYWSPLFPLLQGVSLRIFQPSWRWEPFVVSMTNFMIYVVSVLCFHFFWGRILLLYREHHSDGSSLPLSSLSDNAFWLLGYTIFLYSHLSLIRDSGADLPLSALVHLSGGLMLQIRLRGVRLRWLLALGAALGAGFLAKAILLPLTVFFLFGAISAVPTDRKKILCGAIACAVFFAVVGPYVWAVSKVGGHFTFGDVGPLNYAWHVNRVPFEDWQGPPPGYGFPKHPTRLIFERPAVYEFATPVKGTFPPWNNPVYWNDGLEARFILSDQVNSWERNVFEYMRIFWSQSSMLAGVLVLLAMRRGAAQALREFLTMWYLWAPAAAALLIYGSIHVEGRYIAPFLAMCWAPLFCLIRLPDREDNRRLLKAVVAIVVAIMTARTLINITRDALDGHSQGKMDIEIAQKLRSGRVGPAEKIAVIGVPDGEYWERLAGVSVVAEIEPGEGRTGIFWAAGRERQEEIYRRLAAFDVVALISDSAPSWALASGWKKIGDTPFYFHYIGRLRTPE